MSSYMSQLVECRHESRKKQCGLVLFLQPSIDDVNFALPACIPLSQFPATPGVSRLLSYTMELQNGRPTLQSSCWKPRCHFRGCATQGVGNKIIRALRFWVLGGYHDMSSSTTGWGSETTAMIRLVVVGWLLSMFLVVVLILVVGYCLLLLTIVCCWILSPFLNCMVDHFYY